VERFGCGSYPPLLDLADVELARFGRHVYAGSVKTARRFFSSTNLVNSGFSSALGLWSAVSALGRRAPSRLVCGTVWPLYVLFRPLVVGAGVRGPRQHAYSLLIALIPTPFFTLSRHASGWVAHSASVAACLGATFMMLRPGWRLRRMTRAGVSMPAADGLRAPAMPNPPLRSRGTASTQIETECAVHAHDWGSREPRSSPMTADLRRRFDSIIAAAGQSRRAPASG